MQIDSKYYSTANIRRCIALYWQKIPLFRLCATLIRCKIDKNSALAIAYYAKAVSLYRQTEDFKLTISPFMNKSKSSDCTDGQNTTNGQVESTEQASIAIESEAVESIETEQDVVDTDKDSHRKVTKHNSCDDDILKRSLIERIDRLYCPFKNGYTSENIAEKLVSSLSCKEIVKIVNQAIDFRKCEKGMKKEIYEILYELRLYRLSYSNFCKQTD